MDYAFDVYSQNSDGRRFETPPPPRPLAERVSMNARAIEFNPLTALGTHERGQKNENSAAASVSGSEKMSQSGIRPDMFAGNYQRWLDNAFQRWKPASTTPQMILAQMLYDLDKSQFQVISTLHSNDVNDPMHFSVAVNGNYKSFNLHIYGFWKNDFKISYITMQTTDSVSGKTDCGQIATFSTPTMRET